MTFRTVSYLEIIFYSLPLLFPGGVLEVIQEEVLFKVVSVNYAEPRPLENDDGDNVRRRCVEAKVSNIGDDVIMMSLAPPTDPD